MSQQPPVSNFYAVDPATFIERMAEKLKSFPEINPPKEMKLGYWKTSCAREFPPEDLDNFWFVRSASLLRKLALNKMIGVNRLRKAYGSAENRGHRPKHFRRGSGKIIRRCLQQLEKAGLVAIEERVGRALTPAGHSLVDKVSHDIIRETRGKL